MPDLEMGAIRLKDRIVEGFKERIGDEWDDWLASDRRIIEDASMDAALLSLEAMTGADEEYLAGERAIVNATLAAMAVAGEGRLRRIFWETVTETIRTLASFALTVLLSTI